jgi:hypothetical protein
MNFVAFTIGVALSISIIIYLHLNQQRRIKKALRHLLITFPVYYLVFAIIGKDFKALSLEILVGALFVGLIFLAKSAEEYKSIFVLGVGYILHGIYDVYHNLLFTNAGTPIWWPEFCGIIDVLVGAYALYISLQVRQNHHCHIIDP